MMFVLVLLGLLVLIVGKIRHEMLKDPDRDD